MRRQGAARHQKAQQARQCQAHGGGFPVHGLCVLARVAQLHMFVAAHHVGQRGDARGIHIHDADFDIRGLEGDHRHGRTAYVTGSNAANFHSISVTIARPRCKSKA